MSKLIKKPKVIQAHGNIPKEIKEYIGLINSGTSEVSIAHMKSPAGWTEPGQTPEFTEYTLVLKGMLGVKTKENEFQLESGNAIIIEKGEWVQYSSPGEEGAEYIAVCLPAFSAGAVHRDLNLI